MQGTAINGETQLFEWLCIALICNVFYCTCTTLHLHALSPIGEHTNIQYPMLNVWWSDPLHSIVVLRYIYWIALHLNFMLLECICRQFAVHLQCSPVKIPCICIVLVPCICTVLCICICTVHCNALHLHLHCTSDLHLFALSPFAAASALIARWRDPDWRRPSIQTYFLTNASLIPVYHLCFKIEETLAQDAQWRKVKQTHPPIQTYF